MQAKKSIAITCESAIRFIPCCSLFPYVQCQTSRVMVRPGIQDQQYIFAFICCAHFAPSLHRYALCSSPSSWIHWYVHRTICRCIHELKAGMRKCHRINSEQIVNLLLLLLRLLSVCVCSLCLNVFILPYRNRRRRCRVVILLQYIIFFTIVAYLFHSDFHIYHFTDFISLYLPPSLSLARSLSVFAFFHLRFLRICITSPKLKQMRKSKNQKKHTHTLGVPRKANEKIHFEKSINRSPPVRSQSG